MNIENLIPKVDNILIGGGMVFAFLKYHNIPIGKSLLDEKSVGYIENIYKQANLYDTNIILPIDFRCNTEFANDGDIITYDATHRLKNSGIPENYMGLDIGEKSIQTFSEVIENSKTIIWNGPMGVFEMSNFENGTKNIGAAICRATERGAFSLIGGGDSVAAINKFEMESQVSYISTGGGAMLEYLEGKELPGVKAIL